MDTGGERIGYMRRTAAINRKHIVDGAAECREQGVIAPRHLWSAIHETDVVAVYPTTLGSKCGIVAIQPRRGQKWNKHPASVRVAGGSRSVREYGRSPTRGRDRRKSLFQPHEG